MIQAIYSIIGSNVDLSIWLGPRICYNCYEINRETQEHYDLVKQNIEQIRSVAATATIIDSEQCTACRSHDFYSYRKGDLSNAEEMLSKLIKVSGALVQYAKLMKDRLIELKADGLPKDWDGVYEAKTK